jgi:hypothetical protein
MGFGMQREKDNAEGAEYAEKRKNGNGEALRCKSPPFAKGAKD